MRARNVNRKIVRQNARTPIDWTMVGDLLKAGCKGVEIAARLGICPDTLYGRCEQERNVEFSVFSAQKKADGDALLREAQFKKATKGKDNNMLIWLGKNRLDQREPESKTVEACRPALLEYLDRLMKSARD
jgi:hypothetical protein